MTVTLLNGQLKITLTETETIKYNIDQVFFDSNSPKSGEALLKLLKLAVLKVGFKSNAEKFLIELYPAFDGGCEVWYIPESTPILPSVAKTPVKKHCLFEFDTSEAMLSACELLYCNPKTRYLLSGLYSHKRQYRLSVTGLDLKGFRQILLNFADRVVSLSPENTKTLKNWHCICPKNAIAIIGAAMCKNYNEN